jgi:hypothetical protein
MRITVSGESRPCAVEKEGRVSDPTSTDLDSGTEVDVFPGEFENPNGDLDPD